MEGQNKFQSQPSGKPQIFMSQAPGFDVGVLRVATQLAADGELITIGDDVFEIDDTGDGVAAGNIAVDVTGSSDAGDDCDAIAAAINASNTQGLIAFSDGANFVTVIGPAGQNLVLSESLAGTNNVWDAAAMYSGQSEDEAQPLAFWDQRAAIAADVTRGSMDFFAKMTVEFAIAQVYTATGLIKGITDLVTVTTPLTGISRIRVDIDGATNYAATDVVKVFAIGRAV